MVNIQLTCFADVIDSKNIRSREMVELAQRIEQNAFAAWQERMGNSHVRFLQRMSDSLFRKLTVTQKPDGSLLVYR